jgi:hypothetical protein
MSKLLIVLMLVSGLAYAEPYIQYSEDGQYFRIYNPDHSGYYCTIAIGGEYPFEKIVRAGYTTRWYPAWLGFAWECS